MDLLWRMKIVYEEIANEEREMSKLERQYQLEINHLKRIAAKKDLSEAGEREFNKQFDRVKACQEMIVRAENPPTARQ